MKLNVLLNIIGLCMGVVGAFFLVKGIISISPSQIVKQTAPKWGFNSDLIKSVSFQLADSLLGFILVLTGFVLQLSAIVSHDRVVSEKVSYIVFSIVIICIIISYKLSHYVGKRTSMKCFKLLFLEHDYLNKESEVWVKNQGDKLFGTPKRDNESFEEYKKRLSEFINKD